LPSAVPAAAPVPAPIPQAPEGIPEGDVASANALVAKLNASAPLGEADLATAQDLLARHSGDDRVAALCEAVLVAGAAQRRAVRDLAGAAALLRRAAAGHPRGLGARSHLLAVLTEGADWPGAEAVARELVERDPNEASWRYGLGYSLFRQDRNREAQESLEQALALRDDEATRTLLARLRKGERDEAGMSHQQLAHFNVRYDGDAHEDVGREVLRGLERHFSTLVRALDHQPTAPIPVILFSKQQYFDASGAPAWSGGAYDALDGRIRIPIGGLGAALAAEVDSTLLHEVTHAFVWDMSRGTAPRELHEGLAQYMEGKRLASQPPELLRELAAGRVSGVRGFYLSALGLAEHLIDARGMGGVRELLRALAETGDVDEAFRRVHGQDRATTVRLAGEQLRRRYGG
jgi:tetratricopeptide (TPR) repeat protein